MTNPTGIRPVEYDVLVLPDPIEDTIAAPGGTRFIIAETPELARRREAKQDRATIISYGRKAFEGWHEDDVPKVGERVIIKKHAGEFQPGDDGIEYRLITDSEIKAIIES